LALGSLVAVYLLRPWQLARRPWRIAALERVGDRLWSLTLEPDGHAGLLYRAGQFAWLRLDCSAFSVREHPFSIASAPADGAALRFLIKEVGDFTRQIGTLPIGARAFVDGPHGALCLEGQRAPGIFMIAGGAGLAPMLSLLRDAAARGETRPITLLYGNRHEGQMIASAELAALAGRLRLDLHHVLQEPPPGRHDDPRIDPGRSGAGGARGLGFPALRSRPHDPCRASGLGRAWRAPAPHSGRAFFGILRPHLPSSCQAFAA
jgi:predicted ferric reductase